MNLRSSLLHYKPVQVPMNVLHKITNMQHVRTKATCEIGSTSHWELVTYSGDMLTAHFT